jgi:hypothetical protein
MARQQRKIFSRLKVERSFRIKMTDVIAIPITRWDQPCSMDAQQDAVRALESGSVLLFPQLPFPVQEGEVRLLSPAVAGESKNVSLDPASGTLRGSDADEAEQQVLRGMMMRFATLSRTLICNLFPHYEAQLQQARTSYRPIEVAGRESSWRKDDTRLHVDSFPSAPTQGKRILRLFCNVNPGGQSRTWRLGESFQDVARRFVGTIPKPIWGSSTALNMLGITKSRRSPYDHYMLQLHDRMKADTTYQSEVKQRLYEFPPGSTWIVFTDQVSHAAMGGQYLLEQTFHLPVQSMMNAAQSPLRILENLLGRQLTN